MQDANRVHIDNVTIRNATRDDLHVSSRAEKPNTSGDGYLGPNVLLQHAGRDAMFIGRVRRLDRRAAGGIRVGRSRRLARRG